MPDTPHVRPGVQSLLEAIGKGRPLPGESRRALERILGVDATIEGLSRLFQPGFTGIRAFVVDVHPTPDQAVQLQIVGIARDGKPVWNGARWFALGRDGSLEIHRGFDVIDPEHQSRNITVDLIQRELDLLDVLGRGPSSRLTIDAEGVGRYVCALHGFEFADGTDEGPPVRSERALEPAGDRLAILEAAPGVVEREASKRQLGRLAVEAALEQLQQVVTPWDIARMTFPGEPNTILDTDDGQLGVGDLGRALLLGKETPSWRAALYLHPRDLQNYRLGAEYRRHKTTRSEERLAQEIQQAREAMQDPQRAAKIRALETLGLIAPSWVAADVRVLAEGADRRVAAVARQTLRQISGQDLPERMLAFANDPKSDPRLRGLAYRVLAEHFPDRLGPHVSMLRVHPDARLQRAVVPLVAQGPDDAIGLASMLSANPWEPREHARPGLLELRLELIDRLRARAVPSTLPCLLEAFRIAPPPPPAEVLALSRALVAFPDPRAQTALTEAARRLERPDIP